MNLKNKNNLHDLKKDHSEKETERTQSSNESISIEEQIDLYAELIVDQLILRLNEKKSEL